MKFNKIDSLPKKDKNLNFSLDSSRTTDTISNLFNSDTTPLKSELDIDEMVNLETSSSSNYNDNSVNIKINGIDTINSVDNQPKNNKQYFMFKLQISLIFSIIYFLLFLISMPKRPVKKGEEKNLNKLIKTNSSENLNILINDFKFYFDDKLKINSHIDINETKDINDTDINNKIIIKSNNYEFSGYILELEIDNIYIFRWFIGFLCFIIRCACFTYSEEEFKSHFLNKNRISFIQKLSCLLFPLWVFFYDIKNNISYTKIKNEYINNKLITFYVSTQKEFSMIDYVEGIVPTLFYFLISIIYNGIEQSIGGYIKSRKKIRKLI